MKRIDRVALVHLLHYDPLTGIFRWRCNHGNVKAGSIAGCINARGYWRFQLNGVGVRAHRAAWVYCYGCIPDETEIDHFDGDTLNNRLQNLRLCYTPYHNQENQRHSHVDSATGLIGAWVLPDGRFKSGISVQGEMHHLGYFDSALEAHETYVAVKRNLHEYCTI